MKRKNITFKVSELGKQRRKLKTKIRLLKEKLKTLPIFQIQKEINRLTKEHRKIVNTLKKYNKNKK